MATYPEAPRVETEQAPGRCESIITGGGGMNAKLLSLMLAAVICVGCSASNRETARKTIDPNSLYARIGGLNGMARAVDAMVNHVLGDTVILANKQLQMRAKPENVPGLKVQ